jgi:hypothetical protein
MKKYRAEALKPVIKFRKYSAFEHVAIRKFYSLLRSTMRVSRVVNLLRILINEQTSPGIMNHMPPTDLSSGQRETIMSEERC